MKNRIYEWMIILRHNRLKKIKELESNGIKIFDKRKFLFTNDFSVVLDGKAMNFEVRLNGAEFFFYYKESFDEYKYTNSYYTIRNIYRGFHSLKTIRKKRIIELLEKGIYKNQHIQYGGENFEFKTFDFSNVSSKAEIDIENQKINLIQFLILVSLVQEKSNALFKNKTKYKNGLLNLLFILVITNRDHPILIDKGWNYNKLKKQFELNNKKISALYVKLTVENQSDIDSYLKDAQDCSNLESLKSRFLKLYNKGLESHDIVTLDMLTKEIFIKQQEQTINKYSDLKYILLRDYKKGINDDIDDEDDFRIFFSRELIPVSGDQVLVMILSSPVGYEYYLTEDEKGDIMKVGI